MPVNHVLLETIELSQSAASITFDNIPQTGYTDLKISMSMRSTGNLGSPNTFFDITTVALNGSTSISQQQAYTNGATVYAGTGATLQIHCVGSGATANTFGNAEMYIANYTTSSNKAINVDLVTENNGSNAIDMIVSGLWASSSAVSSIALSVYSGSFVAGSTFSIYGVAATGTTPTVAPKATGGNIVANDGTYWYHAFLSSGTFTPTVALTCDTLVVAGGGGGGGNSGGGGGAGGFRTGTSLSLTASQYLVTVGSGGTGSPNEVSSGTAGSDSIFSTITSTGGGLGAGYSTAGGNGGSGGGGNEVPSTAGGSGNTPSTSPSQGNSGAAGSSASGRGGGGGGAGAAGSAKNGGNGSSTAISGGSATGLGQLSSGTYYFAGGAGAGGAGVSGVGGLGGGGTGCAGTGSTQTAGTANTGGGGGGGGDQSRSGRAGGSGVVIIRYAMA